MELIIVLGIVVVIFGAGRIADLGGALGKGIREFREQTKTEEEKQAATTPAAAAPARAAPVAAVPVATVPDAPAAPAAAPLAATTAAPAGACPSCGRQNPATQPFCGSCGASLTAPAGTASA